MSKNEVIGLLESGVDSAKVAEAAREYGISFSVTAEAESQLRDAGATDELIKALRALAPKTPVPPAKPSPPPPAASPELLVEVTPGGAEVYVDDEPMGTTSQAGRLKLTQLQPGQHIVRVSLAGYRDHEESVELTAGQTSQMAATLEQAPPPAAAGSQAGALSSATPPVAASSSTEPGVLGTLVASQTPPGWRGAYIKDVVPGDPAEKAGLRSGQAIQSVNGQPINSPQELRDTLARFQAGDVIQIGYTDGRAQYVTQARLARRSSAALPSQPTSTAAAGLPGGLSSPGVNPAGPPAQSGMPAATFAVAHDHGSGGRDYCQGVITVGGGMVTYRSANGVHSFDFPLKEIKEARKNSVYLVAHGAFHIRLQQGTNYNFVVLNAAGQHQPPDPLLSVIAQAMGEN
ncbi:MAG: PEGA domain-containing protein [Terriglobia bacterium]|jgi:hypothetical protein